MLSYHRHMLEKIAHLTDLHWGYERKGGHKVPLHDLRALNAVLTFLSDFKPDHIVLGGDMLDCASISHHNQGKPGITEGMRLKEDVADLADHLITPLEDLSQPSGSLSYLTGNHEAWLDQMIERVPALGGILEIENLLDLDLDGRWTIKPQGEAVRFGKLHYIHGDQIRGGEHIAKAAVSNYERNIRFGHFHTYQVYTKKSALDLNGHTGVAVPCLCRKGPGYAKGAPNKWVQGFSWGYINKKEGNFTDYVSVIVNGKFIANGIVYKG